MKANVVNYFGRVEMSIGQLSFYPTGLFEQIGIQWYCECPQMPRVTWL